MFRKIFRTGVIAALVLGGVAAVAVAVAGPRRTHAVISDARERVMDVIDANIDDPVALRQQLREMEREYPKRISQVRGDLAELSEQIRQLDRDKAICERVVELADADLGDLQVELSQSTTGAGTNRLSAASSARPTNLSRMAARVRQIENTRMVYLTRAEDVATELGYLTTQAGRLDELLGQLENEHAQFRGQIMALSRQVDAIARNERLIALVEKHNRKFQECSRYEAVSLDQITGRLQEIRSRQEAELQVLATHQEQGDYEEMARLQLAEEALEARNSGYDNMLDARPLTNDR